MGLLEKLSLEGIINGKAKRNKGHSIDREESYLHNLLGFLPNTNIHKTASEKELAAICQHILLNHIDIALLSGGDGAVHYFMTEYFSQAYQEFGNGLIPIEFARKMNAMALDPDSELSIPYIYHRPRGTVNVYANLFGMSGDMAKIGENLFTANSKHRKKGTRAFRRVYAPILMLYDKEHPENLKHVQLMTLYADGLLFNFFQEYYKPKDRGGSSNMMTAMNLIAKCAASVGLNTAIPRGGIIGRLYGERYMDRILHDIEGEVKTDKETIVARRNKRSALAIGTMGVNLYGLRPFHEMPGAAHEFTAYFAPGMPEVEYALRPEIHSFQLLGGSPDPADIVKNIPKIFLNQPTGIHNMTDTTAKRLEIDQRDVLQFIADGSRHSDGNKIVIEIAYLQPFIILDKPPME